MEQSYRFFTNTACRYYPCHQGIDDFNCLFCFCPFYLGEKCPGKPVFLMKEDRIIKDCSNCTYPHVPEHYDVIMKWIKVENSRRTFSEDVRRKAIPYEQRPHAEDHKANGTAGNTETSAKPKNNGKEEKR